MTLSIDFFRVKRRGLFVALAFVSSALFAQNEKPPFSWVNSLTDKELSAAPGLSHHTYASERLGKDVGYCVFLPPGYGDAVNRERRYPVIYMLHGGRPGDESKFANRIPYVREAIESGKMVPSIVVLNNGGPVSHYNVPGRAESIGKDLFVEELIPLIDATYRTIPRRAGRALQGYSQGGRATARIGFGHPELFSQLVIGSAGAATEKRIQATGGVENENLMFAPGDDMWTYAEIYAKLFKERYPMEIFLHVGDALDYNHDGNIEYHRFLTGLNLPHEFVVIPDQRHGGSAYVKIHDTILGFQNRAFTTDRRTLVFSDEFENRSELGEGYKVSLAGEDAWTFENGALIGKQTRDDHGSVMRKLLDFKDAEIEFDFRLNGGTRFNFVVGDDNEKGTHAGHICRVSISPNRINVSDDKTGTYNLDIRAMRLDPDLSAEKKAWLAEYLKGKNDAGEVDLKQGRWYHLRVRIDGERMEAYLDGKRVAGVNSPGIAHPTKTKFGMTVNGSTIDFDNLKVFAVRD